MARRGAVGAGHAIERDHVGAARQGRVEIEGLAVIGGTQDFEAALQCNQFFPVVLSHRRKQYPAPGRAFLAGGQQHDVGLAYTRACAEIDAQFAARPGRGFLRCREGIHGR